MNYTINDVSESLNFYKLISSFRERKEHCLELVKDVTDIPKSEVSKLLVVSGSFDPLTVSHYSLLLKSLDVVKNFSSRRDGIEQLLFLTPINHVHKKIDFEKNSALQERYKMIKDFAEGKPNVAVGMANTGLFVEFMPLLEKTYGKNIDIYLVCGADLFQKIANPVFYDNSLEKTRKVLYELFEYRFIVTDRFVDGRDLNALRVIEENPVLLPYRERVIDLRFQETEQINGVKLKDISSTMVRELVKEGKEFEPFINDHRLAETITNLELYKENNNYASFVCALQFFADLYKGQKTKTYFGDLINYLASLEGNDELKKETIQLYNSKNLKALQKLIKK